MNHPPILNFIDGQLRPPEGDQWLDNVDPARGEVIGKVANSDASDVAHACEAASRARDQWANMDAQQRSQILMGIADGIDKSLEHLAALESQDGGKPIARARAIEIPRAASNFRFFAAAATQFASEMHDSVGQQAINWTLRQPIGTVGCISPWNLPLYLLTWKVAPALAAGNCVIAKPSELTPQTAGALGEICNQAGLPAGVLNIIQGSGATAGQAILDHPGIKAISFTGGSETGKHVASMVAPQLKKLSLELGGKNPNLVFADCDYQQALSTTMFSSFANQGQICLCGSRVLVERSIYQQFKKDLVERAQQMKLGDPADPATQLGALVSRAHFDKVCRYLEMANRGRHGERVLCGGQPAVVPGMEQGYFVQPTVVEVNNNDCPINQEEIFGPVVSIMPFDSEDEAVALANGVDYGLSATVWTRDLDRMMRVSRTLEAGVVWGNTWLMRDLRTPFGGVKNSGVGREGGWESMRFFTTAKNVCIAYR